MSEKVHLCCGRHILPGWQNHDRDVDIRQRLPYPDSSLQFIFIEHGLEHVTTAEAWSLLKEFRRVLRPGGCARIIVPCVDLISSRYDSKYAEFLKDIVKSDGSIESAIHSIVCNWGHKAIWTTDSLQSLLQALGFKTTLATPGASCFSEFQGIDGHHKFIGEHANWVESGIVEATK